MHEGLLPLFPLELVLFPQTAIPLHIFEDRYKEMINECLALETEFGVVLARGNGILRTGCSAEIEEVLQRHDDGRMDILAGGRRRFEIVSVDTQRTFYRAEAVFFDDEDLAPARRETVYEASARYAELMSLRGSGDKQPDTDLPMLSFQLAQAATDLSFRQALLQTRSEAERMEKVAEHLGLLVERQKMRNAVKKVAGSNGHGRSLPGQSRPN